MAELFKQGIRVYKENMRGGQGLLKPEEPGRVAQGHGVEVLLELLH